MGLPSSDLSLALSSESQGEDDDYYFVGKRKRTPLMALPLTRIWPKAISARRHTHRGSGDEGFRNIERPPAQIAFNVHSPKSSRKHSDEGGGGQSKVQLHLAKEDSSPRCKAAVNSSGCFPASARLIGANHARAALAINQLDESVAKELAEVNLAEDLKPLRTFATAHERQVKLWIQAFQNWDRFIRSLFPISLANRTACPLSPTDGDTLLAVLPSSTTITFVQNGSTDVISGLELADPLNTLLSIRHLPEMAVVLSLSLAVVHVWSIAVRYFDVITTFTDVFGSSMACAELFRKAAELGETAGDDSDNRNRKSSLWDLMVMASDRQACLALCESLKEGNLLKEINALAFDEVLDLVDQADVETTLKSLSVHVQNCRSSLGQSLALIRAVQQRVQRYMQNEAQKKGPSARSASESAWSESTEGSRGDPSQFDSSFVQNEFWRIYEQIAGFEEILVTRLHKVFYEIHKISEAFEKNKEVSISALVKGIIIFVEAVRTAAS